MGAGGDAYEVGETVGLQVTFGSPDDPVDPTRVMVRVMDPAGRHAELTYGVDEALSRPEPGTYRLAVVAEIPGRWRYRFVGTGRRQGAFDGHFDVFDVTTEP